MLGEALIYANPQVLGVRLSGALTEGVTATDLVLTITQTLRSLGVVGQFVEFFGYLISVTTFRQGERKYNISENHFRQR